MTDSKDKSSLSEAEALEIENASYIDVEPVESDSNTQYAHPSGNETKSHGAKTGLLWIVTLLNLLFLAAIVVAGYWVWTQWQGAQGQQQAIAAQQQEMVAQQQTFLSDQSSAQANLKNELYSQTRDIQSQMTQLQQQIESNQLASIQALEQAKINNRTLAEISGRRPSDWLLAEADYLVRMAGRKLWLEQDVKTAILMLQAADTRIQDLADPSLIPVRQFIASDIQKLQQINQVSLTSVALAVSGMIQQVNSLPLALPQVELASTNSQELSGWQRFVKYLTDNFKYQSNSEPLKPLLDEQQQWLAREQLKYALLQAQHALLNSQETLFIQSLQRAIGTLVDHYELQDQAVEQFVGALKNLENTKIARSYPEQLDSAVPLKDLLDSRMNQTSRDGKFEL